MREAQVTIPSRLRKRRASERFLNLVTDGLESRPCASRKSWNSQRPWFFSGIDNPAPGWSPCIRGFNAAAIASIRVLLSAKENPQEMGSEKGNVKTERRMVCPESIALIGSAHWTILNPGSSKRLLDVTGLARGCRAA
jgi:hypothetical protein